MAVNITKISSRTSLLFLNTFSSWVITQNHLVETDEFFRAFIKLFK